MTATHLIFAETSKPKRPLTPGGGLTSIRADAHGFATLFYRSPTLVYPAPPGAVSVSRPATLSNIVKNVMG
jgi:hypothetical protein